MLDLRKYVPSGRVSTGMLGIYRGRQIWAVSREEYWRKGATGTVIGLIGIGGGQEEGETLTGAVAREAKEEVQSRIRLQPALRTVWAHEDGRVEVVDLRGQLDGEPAPLLVWQSRIDYLNTQGVRRITDYICAVFEAEFLDKPTPASETPGIVFLKENELRPILDEPRPLAGVLARGSKYDGRELPGDTQLVLHGSSLYLARHWDLLEPGR